MKPWKSYFIPLTDEDRIRVEIHRRDHELIEFVVQYEALIKGKWMEIVRHDNIGKAPHTDFYDVRGKRIKTELPNIELGHLIPWCVEDLRYNWGIYKERYKRWSKII